MRAAANRMSLGVPEGRGLRWFADTTVSYHYNPAWLSDRASWRAVLHA